MEGRLTGHVRDLGSGAYELVANLPRRPGERRGRRSSKRIHARGVRAAEAALRDWLSVLEQHACTDPERITMGEILRRWLAYQSARSQREHKPGPKTLERYRDYVNEHLLHEVDSRHLVEGIDTWLAVETTDELLWDYYDRKLVNGRIGGGVLSMQTVRHLHATIHAAGAWAEERGLVDRNPASRVKHPPDPRKTRKRRPIWSFDDVSRAIAEARHSMVRVPLALTSYAGLRRSEVCSLSRADVDLKARTIDVTRSVEQTKGEDGPVLDFGEVKTVRSRRRIPIPAQLAELLQAHFREQDEMKLGRGPSWNERNLVCCRADGRPLNPDSLTSQWRQFVLQHKLPRIEYKGLRRSWISRLHDAGVPDHLIMEWAGHEDIRTTHSHYIEVVSEREKEVVRWTEAQISAADSAEVCRRRASAVVSLAARREEKSR